MVRLLFYDYHGLLICLNTFLLQLVEDNVILILVIVVMRGCGPGAVPAPFREPKLPLASAANPSYWCLDLGFRV